MSIPLVISIILNTNRRQDTLECLASLTQSTYDNHKIIVLDNASSDGSVAAIQASFPEVQIINLTENLGYAGNNNVGIKAAIAQGADWVWVLNEDTIIAPDALTQLIDVAVGEPKIGIVGPMVYHHDEPEFIQSAGGQLNQTWQPSQLAQNELDRGQFEEPHQVDWIVGCAILVKRAVIEKIGLLDERFFYYWEETEWCVRARHKGWLLVHVPRAKIWHKGVQRDYHPKPSLMYYDTRNKLLLLAKHHAPFSAWFVTWSRILRTLISWTLKPKWRSKREHRDAMWYGVLDFLRKRWGKMPQRNILSK